MKLSLLMSEKTGCRASKTPIADLMYILTIQKLFSDKICVCSALLTRLATACSDWSEPELEYITKKDLQPAMDDHELCRREFAESDKSAQLMLLAIAADATGKSLHRSFEIYNIILQLEIALGKVVAALSLKTKTLTK